MTGLSPEDVRRSRAEHGSNRLVEIRGRSWVGFMFDALGDRTLRVLLVAAGLVFAVNAYNGHAPTDGIGIVVAVLLAAGVTATNDWRAQAAFKSLQIVKEAARVRALRAGEWRKVSAYDIVVGDVVGLDAGAKIPADGRLVDGAVSVDASTLTGESEPVAIDPGGTAQSGTVVVEGTGTLVVTAVGARTEYGRLRAQLAVDREPTPLQERLSALADRIGVVGAVAAVSIVLALGASAAWQGRLAWNPATLELLLGYLTLGVTVVVVAVPEGLPVAVTISLAYSVRQMARANSLVRRLLACETMGGADALLIDKTGTLTRNRMEVVQVRLVDESAETRARVAEVVAVNATAHLRRTDDGLRGIGNPTEVALLRMLNEWGVDYRELRSATEVVGGSAFSSERKRMSTIVRGPDGDRVLVKGAPEVVLARCGLDDALRGALLDQVEAWGAEAARTLALAEKPLVEGEEPEENLRFLGLVAIADPVRAGASGAIAACRAAGVDVVMVTGDHRATAAAVARAVGLEGTVVAASAVQDSDDLAGVAAVYRAVPSDKLRIVRALRERGRVVGVTGDGTNDGPALRHADVGLAMGKSGTDVAREASDIVILDDDFASVVTAIRWGRAIYANIRKFVQFQLTVSLVALVTAFVAGLTGLGTPLTAIQLLWVNLIMDTLAALALAVEPPAEDVLDRPPHRRDEPLIDRPMLVHIAALGAVMLGALAVALYSPLFGRAGSPAQATAVFNLFVFLQVGNLLNCRVTAFDRSPFSGLARSPLFVAITAAIVVLQVALVSFGGALFQAVPLGPRDWAITVSGAPLMLAAGAGLRAIGRRGERFARVMEAVRRFVDERARPWLLRPAAALPLGVIAGVGTLAMVGGLALRSVYPDFTPASFALFAAGAAAVAGWAWERQPARMGGRLRTTVALGLATLLAGQANYVASRHHRRFDLTEDTHYALSEQTTALLSQLRRPVTFTTVFRRGSALSEIEGLLAEYAAVGASVAVVGLDPDTQPGEVERLEAEAGLAAAPNNAVVVSYDGRYRVVSTEELFEREYGYKGGKRYLIKGGKVQFRGEQALSSALLALTHTDPVEACFASGHGEHDADDFDGGGLALFRDRLRREGYTTSKVTLLEGAAVPARCTVLVQAEPAVDMGEGDVAALDAWLRGGGRWLLTLEPWHYGGLEGLLAQWGLELRPMYVVDPDSSIAGAGATTLVSSSYPPHPITSALKGTPVIFPYAAAVRGAETKRRVVGANIVVTGKGGIGETDRLSAVPHYDRGVDRVGEISVAAVVETPRETTPDGTQEGARVVVVGDTDFLTNAHLGRGANADFATNAVDWLARREELITVRAKSLAQRRVHLSTGMQQALWWLSVGGVPGVVAVLGGAVAWRRRA